MFEVVKYGTCFAVLGDHGLVCVINEDTMAYTPIVSENDDYLQGLCDYLNITTPVKRMIDPVPAKDLS